MTSTRSLRLFVVGAAALLAAALPVTTRADVHFDASISYEAAHSPRLDIDVWTNKEEGGVYRQGEAMRVFFRPSADAYVLIYNIDTEGYIHLVYPYDPDDPDRVEGGRTYQVPSRNDPYDLVADGPTGIEYVVAIASPYPFRDLPWYLTGGSQGRPDEDEYGDDDDSGAIVGDPYVGMDRVVRRVVPRGQEDEVATADTYFYIERRVEYPRYVCADCHSYGGWFDPYGDVCSVVDIRIDAGWAHYRPLRYRVLRPRYFYMIRSTAPTRYRQWKDRWSSIDGRSTLRTRFQVDGTDKFQSRRQIIQRRTPPEFQNLRRPRPEGRLWRPDEVLRRSGDRRDRGGAVDDARDARERENVRRNEDARRREWFDLRQNREEDRRRMQEQRRDDRRRMQEQRRDDQRQMQEQRREDRSDRDRARVEERRREDRSEREQPRQREDRSNRDDHGDRDRGNRGDRGDRGRSDERRRDDGGRGQDREDRGGGRGRR